MDDNVAALQRSIDQITGMVDRVGPTDLTKATTCTEWTVRDLINHLTGGATMFAISAEGSELSPEQLATLGTDVLGDDVPGAWKTASTRAMAAFDRPGVLETIVTLPFGQMPGGVALNLAVFDVTTHACDLAHTLGSDVDDEQLLSAALTIGQQMIGAEQRASGLFGPEQTAPAGASTQDRLLAFAGRKV
jgi:uncharacterized protein (TIGR03086 family)